MVYSSQRYTFCLISERLVCCICFSICFIGLHLCLSEGFSVCLLWVWDAFSYGFAMWRGRLVINDYKAGLVVRGEMGLAEGLWRETRESSVGTHVSHARRHRCVLRGDTGVSCVERQVCLGRRHRCVLGGDTGGSFGGIQVSDNQCAFGSLVAAFAARVNLSSMGGGDKKTPFLPLL